MDFFYGMDPVEYAMKVASLNQIQNSRASGIAEQQFATIFFSEMMKQVFNSQSTLFDTGEGKGYFSNYAPVTDIFVQRMVEEVISSGGKP